ncbi:MAG: hypothetical protein Q8M70_08535, partial [bacterium]|nr:hypothetical protein [bacterium]
MKKRLILTTFLIFFLFGFLAFSFPVNVSASYPMIHNGSVYDLSSVNDQSYERYLANLSASFAGVEVLIDPTTSY